jgi:acetyl-CoA carboxylase biotin carboxyl carrier protein
MTQQLERFNESVAEDERETLREICRNLGDLLRDVRPHARRMAIAVGVVSIEVEWPGTSDVVAAAPPVDAVEPVFTGEPVNSPLVGTFYAASEPGARPFVVVGDVVDAGQQIGIVEAMKLMNAVEAPCRGRVTEILVKDGESVEYDQPLVVLAPLGEQE